MLHGKLPTSKTTCVAVYLYGQGRSYACKCSKHAKAFSTRCAFLETLMAVATAEETEEEAPASAETSPGKDLDHRLRQAAARERVKRARAKGLHTVVPPPRWDLLEEQQRLPIRHRLEEEAVYRQVTRIASIRKEYAARNPPGRRMSQNKIEGERREGELDDLAWIEAYRQVEALKASRAARSLPALDAPVLTPSQADAARAAPQGESRRLLPRGAGGGASSSVKLLEPLSASPGTRAPELTTSSSWVWSTQRAAARDTGTPRAFQMRGAIVLSRSSTSRLESLKAERARRALRMPVP